MEICLLNHDVLALCRNETVDGLTINGERSKQARMTDGMTDRPQPAIGAIHGAFPGHPVLAA
jgi:hypothetical protein